MYPYLFENPSLRMYDLIGVLGYGILLAFFIVRWRRGEKWNGLWLPLLVHLISFTFAGERLAPLVNRGTEFFAYLLISAVALVLAAVATGTHPLKSLDRSAPMYLAIASILKLGCFCGGCCNGYAWEHGLYNHAMHRTEVPIQLVEAVLYALLLWVVLRYRGGSGQRFSLFLIGYSAVRFGIQFFRSDSEVFSLFHWVSGIFLLVGVGMMVTTILLNKRKAKVTTDTDDI